MRTSCGTVGRVELTFLVLLIGAFVALAALAGFVVVKLVAGQR
jgi:hypothetical protein